MAVDYLQPTFEDTLDHDEFALYELIMAHRATLGLPSVPLSASLTLVAGRKVIDTLYNTGTYAVGAPGEARAHGWSDRPYDGRDPATYNVMWEAPQFLGTAYPGYGFEIAVGYTGAATLTATMTPALALQLWLGSPGHRAVIESTGVWGLDAWDAVGVGMRSGVAFVWFGREPDPAGLPVVVADDDSGILAPNTRLAIAPLTADLAEDGASFAFTVTRSGDLAGPSSVDWFVRGAGAQPANAFDFAGGILPSGRLAFAAGEASRTLTVLVSQDTRFEFDETFTVTLSNPSGAVITIAAAAGTIRNDDAPPPAFTVFRGNATEQVAPDRYVGPVLHLDYIFLGQARGEVVIGGDADDFMNLLGGDDAANGGAGRDVLDGGTGSNFLTGGPDADIFFLDGRGGGSTWATITDWEAGEQLSLWGWKPGISRAVWVAEDGAPGYRGATLHADLDGNGLIDTSVTWSGRAQASLPAPLGLDGLLWFL